MPDFFVSSFVAAVISAVFVLVNFIFFLYRGKPKTNRTLWTVIKISTVVILPTLFLLFIDYREKNDCCTDSAAFSPEHRVGIYFLIFACIVSFLISIFRKQLFTPIAELVMNLFMLLGLVINLLLCFHLTTNDSGSLWWIFGNLPIIMILLMELSKNNLLLHEFLTKNAIKPNGIINKFSFSIFKLRTCCKVSCIIYSISTNPRFYFCAFTRFRTETG